jgi:hypothetical protein
LTTTFDVSNTLLVSAIGRYGVRDEIGLTTRIEVFQEINGQVVMEAEHFSLNNGRSGRMWLTQSILADYTGPGYTSALPDTDVLHTTSYTTTSPQLQYTMNFTTTATYYLWLRGYAPNAAGDSVYVALDGQSATTVTGFAPRAWDWASGVVGIEVSEPGIHILQVWQREDGLHLDRILLTRDNTYVPIGNGPPESEIR